MNPQTVYKEEAYELLSELESALLELEEIPEDAGVIGRVFRALHTIKGSGAMFGFDDIASFTHEIETAFDLVRDGKIVITKELINLGLAARDQIRAMLEASEGGEGADNIKSQEIIAEICKLISEGQGIKEIQKEARREVQSKSTSDTPPCTFHVFFRPTSDIFHTGTNPLFLFNELRDIGECQLRALTYSIPMLNDIEPEACYLGWEIDIKTSQSVNAVRDVFIFVEDKSELRIETTDEGDKQDSGADVSGQQAVFLPSENGKQKPEKRQKSDPASSIRVPAAKLDSLVNLVGELVTAQARLSRKASMTKDAELLSISEEVERLTISLRDNTMNIRMVPIETTFGNFRRLVRDLSAELGKDVVLITEGGETELDKTLIEKLHDPMVHIIRNAVDHGIETPRVRESLGKAGEGVICLSAFHSGVNVLIRICDDGKGLDASAIRAKALERGLISPDTKLSEQEIFSLIFMPGLTTTERITEVSGRGVGMDVVRRAIESLRGSVEIESEKGKRTCITLRLPLTLAIIDGLLIRIGDNCFVLPLPVVEECVELKEKDLNMVRSRSIMNFRGRAVPYLNLRQLFMIEGDAPNIEQVVIAESQNTKVGLGVDRVEGQHQTVIKSMGKAYRNAEYISGATILGDGTVALILDVPKLTQLAENTNQDGIRHGR
jgi:two-component system chemotaxis sensor kinase CheA